MALWAVPGVVPFFSTLEASVGGVSHHGSVSLGVILGLVASIAVVVPLSLVVVSMVVALTVIVLLSTGWRSVPVDVHGDRSVVHPAQGI